MTTCKQHKAVPTKHRVVFKDGRMSACKVACINFVRKQEELKQQYAEQIKQEIAAHAHLGARIGWLNEIERSYACDQCPSGGFQCYGRIGADGELRFE